MKLDILSPQKSEYSDEVSLIQLPGQDGSFEILNNHAPIIALLKKGKIKIIDTNNQEKNFEVKGGIIEFKNNIGTILVEM